MSKFKFKKGDRVRVCTDNSSSPKGRTGVVLNEAYAPWVRFGDYNPEAYNDDNSHTGVKFKRGYGDCVDEYNLELVKAAPKKVAKKAPKKAAAKKPVAKKPVAPAYTMTKEDVLAIASVSDKAKQMMAEKYPELFPAQPFCFGERHMFSVDVTASPLLVGNGYAPYGLKKRCLVVRGEYRMETQEYKGRTILTFYKK